MVSILKILKTPTYSFEVKYFLNKVKTTTKKKKNTGGRGCSSTAERLPSMQKALPESKEVPGMAKSLRQLMLRREKTLKALGKNPQLIPRLGKAFPLLHSFECGDDGCVISTRCVPAPAWRPPSKGNNRTDSKLEAVISAALHFRQRFSACWFSQTAETVPLSLNTEI